MIGSKLRALRKSKKMSLKDLSSSTGISITFLSDIEHDRSNPSIDSLKAISKTFNVNPSYFMDDLDSSISVDSEILELIKDYDDWNDSDKQELISYLKAKKIIRDLGNS
ncbi:helix-turn-helix domain-containing protein [Metaclostridioides mangenotii]|uniref:helix-turn-helix domain-containing protein n=1 Tax=Metaclostridioides mangenotii TaxID=1540 RepID=UPI000486022E|nr:helix-turn-helix transcriptional regulator [Clostridioides mangenotii]